MDRNFVVLQQTTTEITKGSKIHRIRPIPITLCHGWWGMGKLISFRNEDGFYQDYHRLSMLSQPSFKDYSTSKEHAT